MPAVVAGTVTDGQRLAMLRGLTMIEQPCDARFAPIVRVAASALAADRALVSLVEEEEQWFVARHGTTLQCTPVEQSFCAHAIAGSAAVMVVPDSHADPRFAGNPLVHGPEAIRFYAGAPLVMRDGLAAGTLCVLDRTPRPQGLTASQATMLTDLAALVVAEIERERELHRAHVVRDELRHRMGNIYAQMSSLVSLMGRSIADRDELVARLQERVNALAATQSLLLRGAEDGISLARVANDSLAAFRNATTRSRITVQDDDDVSVRQRCVFAMTLMFGELASNAIRHGALAHPDGWVRFGWSRNGGMVRLEWKEGGISLAPAKPDLNGGSSGRIGFGTSILRRIVPSEFGGEAELRLEPDGLRYTLTAPVDRCLSD